MSVTPFVHLHCHSHYSLLDGAGTVPALLDRAKALQMNALALTDHGNMHGALQFFQYAKKLGINPIVGYEAWTGSGDSIHNYSPWTEIIVYTFPRTRQNSSTRTTLGIRRAANIVAGTRHWQDAVMGNARIARR